MLQRRQSYLYSTVQYRAARYNNKSLRSRSQQSPYTDLNNKSGPERKEERKAHQASALGQKKINKPWLLRPSFQTVAEQLTDQPACCRSQHLRGFCAIALVWIASVDCHNVLACVSTNATVAHDDDCGNLSAEPYIRRSYGTVLDVFHHGTSIAYHRYLRNTGAI